MVKYVKMLSGIRQYAWYTGGTAAVHFKVLAR